MRKIEETKKSYPFSDLVNSLSLHLKQTSQKNSSVKPIIVAKKQNARKDVSNKQTYLRRHQTIL